MNTVLSMSTVVAPDLPSRETFEEETSLIVSVVLAT